jgi:hypothetical protein
LWEEKRREIHEIVNSLSAYSDYHPIGIFEPEVKNLIQKYPKPVSEGIHIGLPYET